MLNGGALILPVIGLLSMVMLWVINLAYRLSHKDDVTSKPARMEVPLPQVPAAPMNPWPRRLFILIVVLALVPTVLLLIPLISSRNTVREAQVTAAQRKALERAETLEQWREELERLKGSMGDTHPKVIQLRARIQEQERLLMNPPAAR
jgi:uncharacterized membrane protein